MRVDVRSFASLRDKYVEMRRLRLDDVAGAAADPKRAMARLAERFPGALREIDELPLDVIDARIDALTDVVERAVDPPRWAILFVAYHGWMRAALRIKRACLGVPSIAVLETVRASYVPSPDEPAHAELGELEIRAVLAPEGGRLNPWVFARIGAPHGLSGDEVAALLFRARR